MKKSIGILYICTGPYVVFWKDFFDTFEAKFLPDVEKYYYVFSDTKDIYMENECDRVKRFDLAPQPWPLVTLLRFHTFLSIREELEKRDYLMFSNANIVCDEVVTSEEFLPREDCGEVLAFTKHPGYCNVPIHNAPLDRNKKSLAYVPYNCGNDYVIGAMFNGTSKAFLELSEVMKNRIDDDLKRNVIARWHDESHINRFIVGRKDCRILSPSYCYPFGIDLPVEKKISAVEKQSRFDVRKFKGQETVVQKKSLFERGKDFIVSIAKSDKVGLFIDKVRGAKVDVI